MPRRKNGIPPFAQVAGTGTAFRDAVMLEVAVAGLCQLSADVAATADGGTVTPMVRDFSARGPNSQTYS
jgi:hypothetical protein